MIKTRFIFAVSMFAMLVVNSAMAATVTTPAPTSGAGQAISGAVETIGDVYDWTKWNGYATAGIASVSYVNNAVDAAGNAAQWAESHAAAAGTSAKEASDSAEAAAKSAAAAQNISGDNGVTASTVKGTDGEVTGVKVSGVQATSSAPGVMRLYTSATGQNTNGTVTQKVISDELAKKVSIDQTTANKNKAVITDESGKITTGTINSGMIGNGQVMNDDIAGGAVTVAKTTGIYGYIPTASDGTGSAQIWVE